ncbi:hypothetical protein [Sicyoidochytrium minutum DNA virus]|nr:hypothetical protein [Sicyoidochytrium minutum DNA virus]
MTVTFSVPRFLPSTGRAPDQGDYVLDGNKTVKGSEYDKRFFHVIERLSRESVSRHRRTVLIVFILFVLAGGAAALWILLGTNDGESSPSPSPSPSPTPTPGPGPGPGPGPSPSGDEGNFWDQFDSAYLALAIIGPLAYLVIAFLFAYYFRKTKRWLLGLPWDALGALAGIGLLAGGFATGNLPLAAAGLATLFASAAYNIAKHAAGVESETERYVRWTARLFERRQELDERRQDLEVRLREARRNGDPDAERSYSDELNRVESEIAMLELVKAHGNAEEEQRVKEEYAEVLDQNDIANAFLRWQLRQKQLDAQQVPWYNPAGYFRRLFWGRPSEDFLGEKQLTEDSQRGINKSFLAERLPFLFNWFLHPERMEKIAIKSHVAATENLTGEELVSAIDRVARERVEAYYGEKYERELPRVPDTPIEVRQDLRIAVGIAVDGLRNTAEKVRERVEARNEQEEDEEEEAAEEEVEEFGSGSGESSLSGSRRSSASTRSNGSYGLGGLFGSNASASSGDTGFESAYSNAYEAGSFGSASTGS